jgi:hypothetical protein
MNNKDMTSTLNYLSTELSRMETIAATLASIEKDHYAKLTNYDQRDLLDMAIEEQNTSRQLGVMRDMCFSMGIKVNRLRQSLEQGEKGSGEHVKVH